MAEITTNSLIEWVKNGQTFLVTEHNRGELSANPDRIESADRMANGRLRKYYVADKRTWSVSWDELPAQTSYTVDGKPGAAAMEDFYYSTVGEFDMRIKHADSTLDETVRVVFSDFSKTHSRRGTDLDLWDISVSMEEV